jgi:threonine aldolase
VSEEENLSPAAAGIVALMRMIQRLQEDHEHAALTADVLPHVPGLRIERGPSPTNMLFFNVDALRVTAPEFLARLAQHGVLAASLGITRVRLVTHHDVSRAQCEEVVRVIAARTRDD